MFCLICARCCGVGGVEWSRALESMVGEDEMHIWSGVDDVMDVMDR